MLKIMLVLVVLLLVLVAFRAFGGEEFGYMLRRRIGARICALRGHRRLASSVRKVENQYIARCQSCGIRLSKSKREDEWLPHDAHLVTEASDGEPQIAGRGQGGTVLPTIGIGVGLAAAAIALGFLIAPRTEAMRDGASATGGALAAWKASRTAGRPS